MWDQRVSFSSNSFHQGKREGDAPLEGVFARDADRFFEGADDAVTDPVARVAVCFR